MSKLAAVKNHFELIALTNKNLGITVATGASLGICIEGDYALISNEVDSYCLAYEHDGILMLETVQDFCPEVDEFSNTFLLAAKAEEFLVSASKPKIQVDNFDAKLDSGTETVKASFLQCSYCEGDITPMFDCNCHVGD